MENKGKIDAVANVGGPCTSTNKEEDQPPPYSSLTGYQLTPTIPSHSPLHPPPFPSPYYPSYSANDPSHVVLPLHQTYPQVLTPSHLQAHQVVQSSDVKPPPDFFWLSIISTIFCNLIFGLIALICSIRVGRAVVAGQHKKAVHASRWSIVFNVIALIAAILLAAFLVIWFTYDLGEANGGYGRGNNTDFDSQEISQYSDESVVDED